jgi:hypothetical protein
MPTIPQISMPVVIGSGPHLRLTYDDASTDDVTLDADTYYVQGDAGSTDLLEEIRTKIVALGVVSACAITFPATQTPLITITVTGKALSTITSLTSQLYPMDLGYGVSTSTTTITFATAGLKQISQAQFRPSTTWCPSTEDFDGLRTRRDSVVSQGSDSGAGIDDVYTGHVVSSHRIPEVFGVLMRSTLASDADHVANVSDLTSGDTNAALDTWLQLYHARLGGARPVLRWTPDTSTRGTYRSVYLNTSSLVAGIEGWIVETNEAPLFHDLRFELSEA